MSADSSPVAPPTETLSTGEPASAREARLVAGRYRLDDVLGRGGAGTVWRAEDVLLRRAVAIKEVHLPPSLSDDERAVLRERVLREARAAARVHHPTLVTVFDVVEADDRPWIVLELVEAETLASRIAATGPLSPQETARIGLQLLDGLDAVHSAGVLHRDVKPGNVLLTEDGRARLTDFGIAVSAGDPSLTSTGVLIGSPAYLPPERARGRTGSPDSDLWALAAALYTTVEGHPPYSGEHPMAILTAVVEGRRRPMERAAGLEPLLADLLDRDEGERPSATEVRARLLGVLSDDVPALLRATTELPTTTTSLDSAAPASDEPAAEVPQPRQRRRLALRVATLAAIPALLLGAGVLTFGRDDHPADQHAAADAAAGEALPTTAATTAPSVPADWVRYTDPAGWSVAYPPGWRRESLTGNGIDFIDPQTGSYLHIDVVRQPHPSVIDDWRGQEQPVRDRVSDYQLVRLDPADGGDGSRSADWEFTFTLADRELHALNRGTLANGRGYSLYWQTPANLWSQQLTTLQGLLLSFAPAP